MAKKDISIPPSEVETPAPTRSSVRKVLVVLVVLLLAGAIGSASYFYKQWTELKANPNKVAQEETAAVIAAVGKLIVLPEGETPTLATVTEPEKLANQPFFATAKKGDKVLIFTNAKKAILYDPQNNIIKEVAPINIGDTSSNATVSGASTTKK